MTLNLPAVDQVIFSDSPLEEVVCQLRFSPILKIATSVPADFQDKLRQRFPIVEKENGLRIGIAGDQPIIADSPEITWQFRSKDKHWVVSLTKDFIALKTTNYRDFESFSDMLNPVLKTFQELYQPSVYSRVGLRYVNRFVVPNENGEPVNWSLILNPMLASLYVNEAIGNAIVESQHHFVLQTDTGRIGWRYSKDKGMVDEHSAERFTLDFDHYELGEIEPDNIADMLKRFNHSVYKLFRWCLTDDAATKMTPVQTSTIKEKKESDEAQRKI